jgi:UDP-N-acetylglucosamine 1-carboxyvinyltransferase
MQKIVIEGGRPLKGTVRVSGAKNAALPEMAACLLAGGWHTLHNVPSLKDIQTLKSIMSKLGVMFQEHDNVLRINSDNLGAYEAPYELVKTMRASILLLGPLLARNGRARISLPGGCAIGARPVDLHLKALAAMGAEINLDHGYVDTRVDRLRGADIFFDIPTVTGTENIMMAAVTATGRTVLRNAAKEPEVQDLARMLRAMGADIEGDGTDKVVITGVKDLRASQHFVIPDRIEAGTFMIGGVITKGDIKIQGCLPEQLVALIEKLESTGATVKVEDRSAVVKGPDDICSVDIQTMPFPGFPTDLQAQFMALMCVARGSSVIRENVFENRLIHVSELKRMGADIEVNGNQALVRGKTRLFSAPVMATDLRASASLILAGLVAQGGRTEVHRIYHLDRGYEALEKKFQGLGATIWREKA